MSICSLFLRRAKFTCSLLCSALVETELAARYDTYADELEAFVSRHFEDMDDTIASGVSRPATVSGRDAALSCTVFLKSRVPTDTSHSQICFSTFGPNITSSGMINNFIRLRHVPEC